jgi:hypothetical protein
VNRKGVGEPKKASQISLATVIVGQNQLKCHFVGRNSISVRYLGILIEYVFNIKVILFTLTIMNDENHS